MLAPSDFATAGFKHFAEYFSYDQIRTLEKNVHFLFAMQASKISDYKEIAQRGNLSELLEAMERSDKNALYEVQKYLGASQMVRSFFDDRLMRTCGARLNCCQESLLLEGPALFVSRPNTTRLLYKWHSEQHYYPKRRKFLNLWLPIFTDRTEQNGAMHIKPSSHREHWDFAEYNSGPNTFVQYEIPEQHVSHFPTHICESRRGDLIIFDKNLVHKSAENRSPEYAFAIVARVWCPKDDLTLSGNMAATPYGGDIGRADLVVER